MEHGHKEALRVEFSAIAKRVFLLGEIARLALAMRDALAGGDLDGFGWLLVEHTGRSTSAWTLVAPTRSSTACLRRCSLLSAAVNSRSGRGRIWVWAWPGEG
jgi:hypothetical protein